MTSWLRSSRCPARRRTCWATDAPSSRPSCDSSCTTPALAGRSASRCARSPSTSGGARARRDLPLFEADEVAGRVTHGGVANTPGLAHGLLQHLGAGRAGGLLEGLVEVVRAEVEGPQLTLGEQRGDGVAVLLRTAGVRLGQHDLDLRLA